MTSAATTTSSRSPIAIIFSPPSITIMKLDSAIITALDLDPEHATVTPHGGSSFTTTAKITYRPGGGDDERAYFIKIGRGKDAETMFAGEYVTPRGLRLIRVKDGAGVLLEIASGEHESLKQIHAIVPDLCPTSHAHGRLSESSGHFLVTDFLDLSRGGRDHVTRRGESLAVKLAKLHSTPAPLIPGETELKFGFPVPTACGETIQPNDPSASWADFYADNRLRAILATSVANHGEDVELAKMVDDIASVVVPRLLRDGHLGGLRGIRPVVCHGDLWSGNHGVTSSGQAVVFDPSSGYGHSEYDHGIMNMFGGFGEAFWRDYRRVVDRTEPVDEYDDRVALYEAYHHLNHYAMFGGGYRQSAMSILNRLCGRYGGG
jgi:fructosamine-3-kinase